MTSLESFTFKEIVPHLRAGEVLEGITPLVRTPDSWVYQLHHNGHPSVLRVSAPTPDRDDGLSSAEGLARRIEALERGRGLKHFEQLIDYSIEMQAVLTHRAPGKTLPELTVPEINKIKPVDLSLIARALGKAVNRGIEIDAEPSNVLFDQRRGITIIDYHSTDDQKPSAQKEYSELIEGIGGSIVRPTDTAQYRGAWSRVFEDGLTVCRQAFNIEPTAAYPSLAICQVILTDGS